MAVTATYTLAQYQGLLRARASGVTTITVEGRSTTWRSLEELDVIISSIRADLEAAGILQPDITRPPIRRVRLIGTKGL